MTTLTNKDIKSRLENESFDERLVVTPLFDVESSLGDGEAASIDVRLGNQFILMQPQSFPGLDIASDDIKKNAVKYQQRIIKRYHEKFILHPQQLVIGSTLEYIKMPKDLMCYVVGKSTWGRMGLIIATATKVDPRFCGCITLEIINEGEVPLVLYPGIKIAQLVFHKVNASGDYKGPYDSPVGPQFPKFKGKEDFDTRFWVTNNKVD